MVMTGGRLLSLPFQFPQFLLYCITEVEPKVHPIVFPLFFFLPPFFFFFFFSLC